MSLRCILTYVIACKEAKFGEQCKQQTHEYFSMFFYHRKHKTISTIICRRGHMLLEFVFVKIQHDKVYFGKKVD